MSRRVGPRTLASEVSHAFRAMMFAMTLIIASTAGTTYWFIQVSQPQVQRLTDATRAVESAHVAMVDVETSLIAYLSAREDRYLEPYINARPQLDAALRTLDDTPLDQALTRDAVMFQLAQAEWFATWATRAFTVAFEGPTTAELNEVLDEGKALFDDYRKKQATLASNLESELNATQDRQGLALRVFLILLISATAATAIVTVVRRSRLRRDVVAPVEQLRAAVDTIADGDLRPPPTVTGPAEIQSLREGLVQMAGSLHDSRTAATERQERTDRVAGRLAEVVEFARSVSSNLAVSDVLDRVGATVLAATEARAVRVWLADPGDDLLRLAHDTTVGPDDVLPEKVRDLGEGIVGRSAQNGRAVDAAHPVNPEVFSVALPLIVGARVAGVVEAVDARCGGDQRDEVCQHVETLVSHAAAVIEAARLFQRSTELSSRDALTGLANRRRLDEDLARETELALRHARRLSFIMLDLDHFKVVNDTYGHQRGDQVLRELAQVLVHEARSSDSVYRYGGEEFVVLVSEAGAEETAAVAERVRAAVESHFRRSLGGQTVSCGVASVPEHATTAESLIEAADAALYEAKRSGRNRVVVAGSAGGPRHPSTRAISSRPGPA